MKLLGPCVDSLPRVQCLSELLVQNRMRGVLVLQKVEDEDEFECKTEDIRRLTDMACVLLTKTHIMCV